MDEGAFPIIPEKKEPLIVGNLVFSPITDFNLSEKEVEKARLELGESKENITKGLQELRKQLEIDKNVRYRTDDYYLLRFLRTRKFNVDRAYKNLKQLYHLRRTRPDFFNFPENLESYLDKKILTILPYTDKDGNVIFRMDYARWNPEEMLYDDLVGVMFLIGDIISMNPKCQVNGAISLWDMAGLNMKLSAVFLKNERMMTFISLLQDSYPWRSKKTILINTSAVTRFLYNIARPLLSRKFKERVFLLGSDLNELHKHLDPAILPKANFGGHLEEEEISVTKLVMANLPYLKYERSFV